MPALNIKLPSEPASSPALNPGQLMPFQVFLKANGISRSRGYELLNSGDLKAVKIGARTFVRNSDADDFIAGLRAYRPPNSRNIENES